MSNQYRSSLSWERDQVVISNGSKLQDQKKKKRKKSFCSLHLFWVFLHWNNKKKKSIPNDENKSQNLYYMVKKDKSILQKEIL